MATSVQSLDGSKVSHPRKVKEVCPRCGGKGRCRKRCPIIPEREKEEKRLKQELEDKLYMETEFPDTGKVLVNRDDLESFLIDAGFRCNFKLYCKDKAIHFVLGGDGYEEVRLDPRKSIIVVREAPSPFINTICGLRFNDFVSFISKRDCFTTIKYSVINLTADDLFERLNRDIIFTVEVHDGIENHTHNGIVYKSYGWKWNGEENYLSNALSNIPSLCTLYDECYGGNSEEDIKPIRRSIQLIYQ
jgi:hypothetical protein